MTPIENQGKLTTSIKNRMTQRYKFCILAAGRGTRNTSVAGLHKALLPIENKSVISHIISKVPLGVEIVIAVGYKSSQLISFLSCVFPKRNINYVHVGNYQGPGSGPGFSLLQCKDVLQCPFIFTSVDTIVEEEFIFDRLTENWIGVSPVTSEESSKYCLVKGGEYLESLYYGKGNSAYIGMAGVYDYESYWSSLDIYKSENDEHQVTSGFRNLRDIKMINLTWHDTGNNASYEKTRKHFSNEIVATKNREALYVEGGKVIKYFDDSKRATMRIQRTEFLSNSCPKVKQINKNMYCYEYVSGQLLSNILDDSVLKSVLDFYKQKFISSFYQKTDGFLNDCQKMYYEKTLQRIEYFAESEIDKIQFINGVETEPIKELIKKVDWGMIYHNSTPSLFHGDFQPENIIHDGDSFKLIDWRESFGDSIVVGDLYYDLGKLYHALLINGQSVLAKEYGYSINENSAFLQYKVKSNLLYMLNYFEHFCNENDLDWDNVVLLGILQYIGISSLYEDFHEGEYGRFLFLLGKYLLTKKVKRVII